LIIVSQDLGLVLWGVVVVRAELEAESLADDLVVCIVSGLVPVVE
jgi:hypothetical protein